MNFEGHPVNYKQQKCQQFLRPASLPWALHYHRLLGRSSYLRGALNRDALATRIKETMQQCRSVSSANVVFNSSSNHSSYQPNFALYRPHSDANLYICHIHQLTMAYDVRVDLNS